MRRRLRREKRIGVLHVVHDFEVGGLQNGIASVACSLEDRVATHVVCLAEGRALANRLPDTATLEVLGKHDGVQPAIANRLRRLAAEIRPTLIHTHNLGPLIYTALAGAPVHTPVLHGEHGRADVTEEPRKVRLQRALLYRLCRTVHTVSDESAARLRASRITSTPICALRNGVDTERFRPGSRREARSTLELPQDARLIGVVGRFVATKRQDVAISAFESLAASRPGSILILVGAGGAREKTIRARIGRSPQCDRILIRTAEPDQMPAYYRALDILLLPSGSEGVSNALLEALACGVPILAHEGSGAREVLTPNEDGLVADLRDGPAIAHLLRGLLSDPSRLDGIGDRARMTALTRFSLQRMSADYWDVYDRLSSRAS